MLAEKFCLLLEALRERDRLALVQSTSAHIPVVLPAPTPPPTKAKPAT